MKFFVNVVYVFFDAVGIVAGGVNDDGVGSSGDVVVLFMLFCFHIDVFVYAFVDGCCC